MGNCRCCLPAFFVIILANACGIFRESSETDFNTNSHQKCCQMLTRKLHMIPIKGWFEAHTPAFLDTQTITTDPYWLGHKSPENSQLHLRGGDDPGDHDENDNAQVECKHEHAALNPDSGEFIVSP